MSSVTPALFVRWMRAAGEPSRLRLLARCAEGGWSVSDLAQALRQSEPRVSRHLKILCEAGLVARLREGQWVHYRLADTAEAVTFVRGLLAQIDQRDPLFVRDRAAIRAALVPDPGVHGADSRLGRALAAFVAADSGATPRGATLVIGVQHLELLESASRAAHHCSALAPSRRAAQSARAFAERRGFLCRVLEASSPEGFGARDLARAGATFGAVLIDHPLSDPQAVLRLLERVRAVLTPGGQLWLFERYESLEGSRERVIEHPLARLRRLLGEAGFVCERLSPIEADGEHVLAAQAHALAAGPAVRDAGVSAR